MSWDIKNPHESVYAWDNLADEKLPGWEEQYGGQLEAQKVIGFERPFGPPRKASRLCKSGKRDYCTCDTCF